MRYATCDALLARVWSCRCAFVRFVFVNPSAFRIIGIEFVLILFQTQLFRMRQLCIDASAREAASKKKKASAAVPAKVDAYDELFPESGQSALDVASLRPWPRPWKRASEGQGVGTLAMSAHMRKGSVCRSFAIDSYEQHRLEFLCRVSVLFSVSMLCSFGGLVGAKTKCWIICHSATERHIGSNIPNARTCH